MSATIPRRHFGKDPLDDPIVAEWDAIVDDEPLSDPDWDADRVALLRQFHALDEIPMPSPGFFDGLEQRLTGMALAQPAPDQHATNPIDARKSPSRRFVMSPNRKSGSHSHRWMPLPAAAAALALVALAGLIVLYRAVPSPSEAPPIPAAVVTQPALRTVVKFDFDPPMWGMPEATTWTHMDFSIIELAPGKSFDTTAYWYTSAQGPLLLMVLSGELSMQPAGPALFYPDIERQHQPEQIAPGKTVAMAANSAIAYSIADTGFGTNPGGVPMVALIGLTGKEDLSLPYSQPTEVRSLSFEYVDGMTPPPTNGAHVSIQRLRLTPFDSFVFDPDQDWRYLPALDPSHVDGLQLASGAISGISPSLESRRVVDSFVLHNPSHTPLTLFNLGEESVDIYFFVVEPYPDPATPTP